MKNLQHFIKIKGAKENNLKNIDIEIPKNKFIVFTGVSGSGKSSLAFNTIYEEGKRRYVESLSSYARQFLGSTKKPDVLSIEGLSPTIAIEQKTTHNNPRSTVGTVTEIYDYLRLLYSKAGKPFCPRHKTAISSQTTKDILDSIYKFPIDSKLLILSPLVNNEKGSHQLLIAKLKKEGFVRLKIDDQIISLDDEINLEKNKKHNISIVVDRVTLTEENRSRISEAIDVAAKYSKGLINIEIIGQKTINFSKLQACQYGDFNMPKIETKLFSFNSPAGMCNECKGIGVKLKGDFNLLITNKNLSINEGAIVFFPITKTKGKKSLEYQEFEVLLNVYNISKTKPISQLSKKEIDIIKYGSDQELEYELYNDSGNVYSKFQKIEGIMDKIERKYLDTTSEEVRSWCRKFMSEFKCEKCKGARLNEYALAVKISELNIYELNNYAISDILNIIENIKISDFEQEVLKMVLNELKQRLGFLINVGLDYLTLNRKSETLSGGESQRIRLATQIGSNLTGVLYVLDEPSIGLHQKDNQKLIDSLKKMVDIGNTLIVVEHDEDTIIQADYIVDIGPYAGDNGGQVVAQGTFDEIIKAENSETAKYFSKQKEIEIPKKRRSGNGQFLIIRGAEENNLKKIDVKIPLNKFVTITGVSGSGKSTLINEILVKAIENKLLDKNIRVGKHKSIDGIFNVDKVIQITQSPIGRTPRSNPATYISVFDDIRDVFANLEESKARGYLKGKFSFNVSDGKCEKCFGDGQIKIEMHFLPDVYVICDFCEGTRYKPEILEIKYKNKNISDVLNMTVEQAYAFFKNRSKIALKLKTLVDVGLEYIKLGQSATTLSGGEAQRVKLAKYLQKKPTGKTIYVLDEPTTGLHIYDVQKLLNVLNNLVDNGDSVIIIEHNLELIKVSDYIIDLGPGGGKNGGSIIATGTPEAIASNPDSFTGQYLKKILVRNEKN
ncbi:excinuclease ABC subunit UvrA [Mesomycoplasma neurolyticum]|uniref:UvrABC system protein A n=1 Tax=Mesomycoplasma neurolyticum TaxID=2120 RepID=A0A449A4A7_9BACT|nr:excinuclease ABC subunit UvrA [Mesomycoplasma neurolyticum]VEU59077.1 cobalt ABC transporter ATPase component [Mesomycoplasma neurolyticum]